MASTEISSVAEAAHRIGCSIRTVQRVAGRHAIGARLGPALYFSQQEIARLRALVRAGPGNPTFVGLAGAPAKKPKKR